MQWVKRITGLENVYLQDVIPTADGGFLAAGRISQGDQTVGLLLKCDETGDVTQCPFIQPIDIETGQQEYTVKDDITAAYRKSFDPYKEPFLPDPVNRIDYPDFQENIPPTAMQNRD